MVCRLGRAQAGQHMRHNHHQKRSGTCKNIQSVFSAFYSSILSQDLLFISPHTILAVGHLSNYTCIEPDLIAILVLGDNAGTNKQSLQCWVVFKCHMVPREKTLPFILKLHLVLEIVPCEILISKG